MAETWEKLLYESQLDAWTGSTNLVTVGDLVLGGGGKSITFAPNDYLQYDFGNNRWDWIIGGADKMQLSIAALYVKTTDGLNLSLATNKRVTFSSGDYIQYDTTNEWWDFVIGSTEKVVISANGFSDPDQSHYVHFSGNDLIFKDPNTAEKTLTQLAAAGSVGTAGVPVDDDFAKFTDANTIEGRSYAEVKQDLDLEIGTDVLAQQTIGIANDNLLEVDGAPNDNEYARFTANGLEGRTEAEFKGDFSLAIGTDVLAEQTIGIADNNLVEIDDADAADNDYAKFTASGLEGRSYAEVKSDLSLNLVENTALSTWAGTTNLVTVGDLVLGGGNKRITFATGDYLQYNTGTNTFHFYVGGVSEATIDANGLCVGDYVDAGSGYKVDGTQVYQFHPEMKTHVDWEGKTVAGDTGWLTLDTSVVFGIPAGVKAVSVMAAIRDSGAVGELFMTRKDGGAVSDFSVTNQVVNVLIYNNGVVLCDNNGDFQYQMTTSGDSTAEVWLRMIGYWI